MYSVFLENVSEKFVLNGLSKDILQDSSHFYLFMSSQAGSYQGSWQIKRVVSSTGPVGTSLSDACRQPVSVPGQTELLWISSGGSTGWEYDTSYRFNIRVSNDPLVFTITERAPTRAFSWLEAPSLLALSHL